MAQFMQIGGADFFAKNRRIAAGEIPEVFEVENDLRRDGGRGEFLLAKRRTGEQSQGVRFDSVRDEIRVGHALKGDRDFSDALAQRRGQGVPGGFHLGQGELFQVFPIGIHASGGGADFVLCPRVNRPYLERRKQPGKAQVRREAGLGCLKCMADNTTNPGGPGLEPKLKIYFLPNLLTAGNLFCGFVALTKIVEAKIETGGFADIKIAMAFILAACVFDLFDGRVARMIGADSPFGREFDSLADLISFGAAPAFLVHRIVLKDVFGQEYAEIGWFVASIYLVCGAFRLARFNCLATMPGGGASKEFLGFPIPSAAALVTSLTLFMIWLNEIGWMEEKFSHSKWRYLLPILMLFLSWMMVSRVKYPSFKVLNLRTTRSFPGMLVAILLLGSIVVSKGKVLMFILPLFFTAYLIYGFIRPRLSRRTRRDIIEEEDDEDDDVPRRAD